MQDIVPPGLLLAVAVLVLLGLALARNAATDPPGPAAQPGVGPVYCLLAVYAVIFTCVAYSVFTIVWEALVAQY